MRLARKITRQAVLARSEALRFPIQIGDRPVSINNIVPDVLSLLVCDQIIIDRLTGKTSLVGLFSNLGTSKFPVRHPQLCVYAALTDGRGKTKLDISIVDSEEARPPVVKGSAEVMFKDPRAVACLNLHFNGLVFPEGGEYRVQLMCQGELLREARLNLGLVRRRRS